MQDQFNSDLEALFYVYGQLDGLSVLDTRFPGKDTFYEDKVANINYSFLKFLDANPELDDSLKTCINAKYASKEYTSIYDIFHDIKLSCILKILEYEDNAQLYVKIDQFYKISVELLLREALRFGVALKNGKTDDVAKEESKEEAEEEDEDEDDEAKESEPFTIESHLKLIESTDSLEKNLEKDFDVITSTFYNNTGKSLSIFAAGDIPFFSSLNNLQSELDDREPIIDPSFGITINNIIPNISMVNNENLSKFTNQDGKMPNIRQILENYMHPNWLRLISSQWLKHGNGLTSLNFSFAPTCDETQSIISNDWKGLTWCQQIGFKKLLEAKEKYDALVSKTNGDVAEKKEEVVEATEKVERDSSVEKNDEENDDEEEEEEDEDGEEVSDEEEEEGAEKKKIDLANILQFDYNGVVTDDEVRAVSSNSVQSTVSDLLNELSQLRQDRIERQKKHARYNKNMLGTGSRIFKPSGDETKLYFKIKRLLTGLIAAKDVLPVQLELDIDKRLPVLQHTYQGTLPASLAVANQKTLKTKRKR